MFGYICMTQSPSINLTSVPDQVQHLLDRGMAVNNRGAAERSLTHIGFDLGGQEIGTQTGRNDLRMDSGTNGEFGRVLYPAQASPASNAVGILGPHRRLAKPSEEDDVI